jgi:CubicO group peptidase (beta-lactamase class C family)
MFNPSFICRKAILPQMALACALFSAQSPLQKSIPEKEGISSEAIVKFLQAANKSQSTEFKSFMLLRHGKVISDVHWNPYQKDLKNRLYSCSKSFTATAIGFAVQENRIKVTDKVISFFPDKLPSQISDNLKELSIQNLLTMSSGMEKEPDFIRESENDWVKAYLAAPIDNKPGSKFNYSSLATFMLSAIIQKVTGETVADYLKPRLFEPLGIKDHDWENNPQGINTGGWGLRVKTEDMAKFAQLFLQKGKWTGKQILSEEWIKEASSAHILQNPNADEKLKNENDWVQGYGYQMWRNRFNSFRGDGAYGQFMLILPEQDTVVIITAESNDLQKELNLVWEHLLPAFRSKVIPENKLAYQKLKDLENNLSIEPLKSKIFPKINKVFNFTENKDKYQSVELKSNGQKLEMKLIIDGKIYPFEFTSGKWNQQETMRIQPTSDRRSITDSYKLYPAKITNSFHWKDEKTLELKTIYLETPHSHLMEIIFDNDSLVFELKNSADFGKKSTILKATEIK